MKQFPLTSLYIHYPFCRHLCNYCDFFKTIPRGEKDIGNFEHYLLESSKVQERLMAQYGYAWHPLKTLYMGGGTPSLWGERGSRFLKKLFQDIQLVFASNHEWTMEVNPRGWDDASMESFISLGVNRFSLGIQSFDSTYLKILDRIHNTEDVEATLVYFKSKQYNFSVDFMLGLPFSKKRKIREELKRILSWDPPHLSVYILTVKRNYKHYNFLPKEEALEEEYLEVSDFLKDNGYIHYEVSNFAQKGFQSKHNFRYWRNQSVAALGPSATGFLSEEGIRYKWQATRPRYEKEVLTEESRKMEEIYLSLRTMDGVEKSAFKRIPSVMERWKERGYLREDKEKVVLDSKGFLMVDSLMNDLFLYGDV